MSLEYALLDRLEKRSLQIAQQKNESYGLRQLVNEKMAINEQLAEQVTTARLERDQMQHQISELRTECDRIREISKSLVPKSALKQAVQEAAELQSKLTRTRLKLEFERDKLKEENKQLAAQIESDENVSQSNREHAQYQIASLTAEVARLRAEVPLESTRDGLKNAVAKLQEVTTERDRVLNELSAIVAEANKTGRCGGDPVALIKQGHADWVAMEGMERQLEAYSSLSNARALEIRKLMDGHAEDMKAQAELTAQLDSAKGEAEEWLKQCNAARRQRDEVRAEARKETQRLSDLCAELQSKYESLLAKTTDLGSYAMTLGRKEGEPLEMFMERQALRLAALESQAGKIGYVAKGEHEEAVTAARENGIHKGESLSGFIWRQCEGLRKSKAENAPLNKLFVVLCKQRGNLNEEIIYRAVDEASEEIRQLTA